MRKAEIPRGFRDFPPEVMRARIEVINKVRKVFERAGFPPMDTPSLEYWETLAGKYGPEAEERLIWRFKDPFSEKDYALRYDLTVPLARYIAQHPEIQLPFKRHQISLVWRHEEPQKGRYREFLQADIDTVGSPHIEADAEIINTIAMALEELGLDDYIIKVNHRGLLRDFIEKRFGRISLSILRTIDKLDKIGEEGVKKELLRIGISEAQIDELMVKFERLKLEEVGETLIRLYGSEANQYKPIFETLSSLAYRKDKILFDFSLVRGLDYYTGIIFEAILTKGSPGSVSGGGRYDNLISLFKGEPVPATGGSLGIERIIDVMIERGILNLRKSIPGAFIIVLDEEAFMFGWRYLLELRKRGVIAEIDIMRRSLEKQKKRMNALNYKYAIYVGKKEMSSGSVTLVDRETGSRTEISVEDSFKLLEGEYKDEEAN
jgi:histidyl-tRNA synthetase